MNDDKVNSRLEKKVEHIEVEINNKMFVRVLIFFDCFLLSTGMQSVVKQESITEIKKSQI